MSLADRRRPRILPILILGSYDPETKPVLEAVREELSKLTTVVEDIYVLPLLLEQVEIFLIEAEERLFFLVEEGHREAEISVIDRSGVIRDRIRLELPVEKKLESVVLDVAKDIAPRLKGFIKLPVMEKLAALAGPKECLLLLIRHVELTRGGEYIELAFLTGRYVDPGNIYFICREGVPLSEMAHDLIELFRLNFRTYREVSELVQLVRRIVNYRIKELLERD